jgi:hypothetical protein
MMGVFKVTEPHVSPRHVIIGEAGEEDGEL